MVEYRVEMNVHIVTFVEAESEEEAKSEAYGNVILIDDGEIWGYEASVEEC